MVRKSFFLIALISISSQSFLISSNHVESEICERSHFMHNEMSYKDIIQLLDDIQSQPLQNFSALKLKESLRLVKVSIEKDISSYYYDQKKVLTRKLLQLNKQLYQLRICRPRVIFSILTPLTAALSYYYLQDELSTKWKFIVVAMGGMSLMGLADYADFIGYTNKKLVATNVIEVDIEDTINELIILLS